MNIKISIADENTSYLERLVNVLSQEKKFFIASFDSKEKFVLDLENNNYDIVLFSSNMYNNNISKSKIAVHLADGKDEFDFSNASVIKKFQRISIIKKLIFDLYVEISPNINAITYGETLIHSVYSCVGGVGENYSSYGSCISLQES